MKRLVSDVAALARYQWPQLFKQLGINIPEHHRHGPCPCCGGKDRFRMDDLDGRGTWFCNQCGAGDGLDLIARYSGGSLIIAARKILDLNLVPLALPVREIWQTGNIDVRVRALLRHCDIGEAPYLVKRGWHSTQWLLTEKGSRVISNVRFGAGTLVLPLRDIGMRLTGVQFIRQDGCKYLLPGSHLKSSFCPVHEATANGIGEWLPDHQTPAGIVITEGYATALAVAPLHYFPVVAALSANNLLNVARALRLQWPECHLILAGDNDTGKATNTGWQNAEIAARDVNGYALKPYGGSCSDWDEFYRHYGAATACDVFNRQLPTALRS